MTLLERILAMFGYRREPEWTYVAQRRRREEIAAQQAEHQWAGAPWDATIADRLRR